MTNLELNQIYQYLQNSSEAPAVSLGLSASQLEMLPVFTYYDHYQLDQECTICLGAFSDGESLKTLPCLHNYHSICIDQWLGIQANCPLCKQTIDPS